jgi:molybdopterin converting factor small subunit
VSHNAGIWIDHRKAVIVELAADGETLSTIESRVEKHSERGGDSPLKGPYEARQVPADDSRQRALTAELNSYYDAVIAAVADQDAILLFGPGEAKGEFHKRLSRSKAGARVDAVETADKMTDRQIIAKVRTHFGRGAPREPER